MIRAYDKTYLSKFQVSFATMIDFAVYDLKMSLEVFYNLFLISKLCREIQNGNTSVLAGKSGVEMAIEIIGDNSKAMLYKPVLNKSPEYWTGWALSYYQWYTSLTFENINYYISINEILSMYSPYHESDISKFVQHMLELYKQRKKDTNLKIYRQMAGLSQGELSKLSGISLRTIQQYEQRQKNINNAKTETVLILSKILSCKVSDLVEVTFP